MNPFLSTIIRNDFQACFEKGWMSLHGESALFDRPYLRYMAANFELCGTGEQTRLAVFAPPRHGKSTMASSVLPAWLLGRDPKTRIICVSHDETLTAKLHNDTRRLMNAPFYEAAFPALKIERSTNDLIETSEGGFRAAKTLGGNITGHGGDYIIIDDPINAKNVNSETVLEKCKEDLRYLLTRLDHPKEAVVILVMQRFRMDDPGALVADMGWPCITLPLIAPRDEIWTVRGRILHHRRAGDYLDPDHIGPDDVARIKREIGSRAFEAQFQQNPLPDGGGVVQWDWFRFYERLPTLAAIFQSWDVATTMSGGNYSACTTWGYASDKFYLIDVFREQVDMPTLLKRMRKMDRQHRPNFILIENVGAGRDALQMLRRDSMNHVLAGPVRGDKAERLDRVTPMIERGDVLLPPFAPWLAAFRAELTAFPHGKFDDMVDSFSLFLGYAGKLLRRARVEAPRQYGPRTEVKIFRVDLSPMRDPW